VHQPSTTFAGGAGAPLSTAPSDVVSARTAAIAFEALRVEYSGARRGLGPVIAVRELSFEVDEGEVFGFLGPNGAGKTSSLNVLLGFVRPTRGRARIYGLDVSQKEARQRLGFLPEQTYYYKYLTARELLHFYARLFGISGPKARRKADELLELVGLQDAADKLIGSFSKGMQQRAGLAQALVNDPGILVLDEPTSGLDPIGRMQVRSIIQRLKSAGRTVLFSSHELGEVETVCDRVAILHQGELKTMGPVAGLVQQHRCNLEQLFLRVVGWKEEAS
jgi:ABC-2 type transport system ATP-binding protein